MRTANLSVVIANRNHARYLPRALDAVLSQSLRPREMILVDDDSTDDSVRILEGYARRFPDIIRFVRNECHRGVTRSYNRGFALATSEYTLAGGADDYILPGFIEKAMEQFAQYPQAGMCLGFGSCTDGDCGSLIVNDPGWCQQPTYFTPEEVRRRLWHTLPVSALIRRRDAILAVGGYRPELAWYSDWFADIVIAFRSGIIHIPETLGIRVRHPGSYETNSKPGAENVRLLGTLLDLLLSPEFADVAPYFRRNGAPCHFGPDLLRAAAKRPDWREPRVLGFLTGFAPAVYETLAARPNPPTPFPTKEGGAGESPSPIGGGVGEGSLNAVRELAAIFLQDPWRELIARRADLEAENRRLVEEVQLTRLRAAPPGALGKLRWAAGLVRRKLRKAVGLHPIGRFR